MWWNKQKTGSGRGRRAQRRGFSFERLEAREMMAVTTSLSNGTLLVLGDGGNDNVAILGSSTAGQLTITGRNNAQGQPTLVNGVANGSTVVSGVTADLNVDLGLGDDTVAIDNTFLAGVLAVTTDEGNDTIVIAEFNPVSPAKDLIIDSGDGNDVIYVDKTIYNTFVVGTLTINGGSGNDFISVYGASALGTGGVFFSGGFYANGGTGNDTLRFEGVTSARNIRLYGDTGANILQVIQSSAVSYVTMESSYTQNLLGEAGSNTFQVDIVSAYGITISGATMPNDPGGPRTNSLSVSNSICQTMTMSGGVGSSNVTAYSSRVIGGAFVRTVDGFQTQTPTGNLFIGGTGTMTASVTFNRPAALTYSKSAPDGNDTVTLTGNEALSLVMNGADGVNLRTLLGNVFTTQNVQNFL